MDEKPAQMESWTPVLGAESGVDYEARQRAENQAKQQALSSGPSSSQLLTYVEKCKQDAIDAKQNSGVTDRLLDAQRRREGKHTAEKIAELAKYNRPNYWVPVTQTKCIHTEAWLRDLLMPYADKIWLAEPTVLPELPEERKEEIRLEIAAETVNAESNPEQPVEFDPEETRQIHDDAMEEEERLVVEEAKECAKAMERLMQDQHEQCDFRGVFREFQSNLVTYGTAFLKGPFTSQKKMPRWVEGQRTVVDTVIPTCSAPSPHDIFPAPWAKNEQEGYIVERIRTFRDGLNEVKDLPQYQGKEIKALLTERQPTTSTSQPGDTERNTRENKPVSPLDDRIECWQFTGSVPGYMLADWGVKNCQPDEDYRMEVLWSGSHILKVLPLWDEVGTIGYFGARFKVVPGSFWGVGVPHLMSASQDRANMAVGAMIYNANWASAPTGWVDQTRLVYPDDAKKFFPGKLFLTQSNPGQNGAPMEFLDIAMHIPELNAIYQGCLADADNESGVPAYMYGSGSAGAGGGTYSGLQTLMNAAARGIKDALLEIGVMLSKFLQFWADWNLEYVDDPKIKGDIRIVCSAGVGLFVQELQLSNLDNLLNQAVSLAPAMGAKGPAVLIGLLREKMKILKIDTRNLPTEAELMQQPPPLPGAQSSGESPGAPVPQMLAADTQPGARPEAPPPLPPAQGAA